MGIALQPMHSLQLAVVWVRDHPLKYNVTSMCSTICDYPVASMPGKDDCAHNRLMGV